MAFDFHAETQEARFHSPLEDFEEVGVEVEVREDPLTGRQSRIVPEAFPMPEDDPDVSEVVEDDEGCFFCPGMVDSATPTYGDWFAADRGEWGAATSFPNLNPYGGYSNVVALTEDHYRPLDELGAETFADGLRAALEYVGRAMDHDEAAAMGSVNMNFLRPAGASLVHPHLQTLVDDRGTNEQRRLVAGAREYRQREGSNYWADLVAATEGDRHVGTTGDVEWIAPFAPKHHRHVVGVVPGAGVPDPGSDLVEDLAAGIASVLDYYGAVGHNAFNMALYLTREDPANPPVVELVARSVFDEFYWSDSPFFTVLHDEGVVDEPPEAYGPEAAEHF